MNVTNDATTHTFTIHDDIDVHEDVVKRIGVVTSSEIFFEQLHTFLSDYIAF